MPPKGAGGKKKKTSAYNTFMKVSITISQRQQQPKVASQTRSDREEWNGLAMGRLRFNWIERIKSLISSSSLISIPLHVCVTHLVLPIPLLLSLSRPNLKSWRLDQTQTCHTRTSSSSSLSNGPLLQTTQRTRSRLQSEMLLPCSLSLSTLLLSLSNHYSPRSFSHLLSLFFTICTK